MSALALLGASFQWQAGWQLNAATSFAGSTPTHWPAWAGAASPRTATDMPASAAAALVMARAFMDPPEFDARNDVVPAAGRRNGTRRRQGLAGEPATRRGGPPSCGPDHPDAMEDTDRGEGPDVGTRIPPAQTDWRRPAPTDGAPFSG